MSSQVMHMSLQVGATTSGTEWGRLMQLTHVCWGETARSLSIVLGPCHNLPIYPYRDSFDCIPGNIGA